MRNGCRRFDLSRVLITAAFIAALLGGIEGLYAQDGRQGDLQLQKEMQVMKSILSTTLSFVGRPEQASGSRVGRNGTGGVDAGRIDALYLQGQGAVFIVSLDNGSSFDPSRYIAAEKEIARLEASGSPRATAAELRLLRSLMRHDFVGVHEFEALAEIEAGAAGAGDEGQVPARLRPLSGIQGANKESRADIKQEIDRLKKELAETREQAEANRRRLEDALVDVLSRYGDSLTQLRPDEYVNLIISAKSGFGGFIFPEIEWGSAGFSVGGGASDDHSDMILTVKMSDIRDYRAGRIDQAAFTGRIRKY